MSSEELAAIVLAITGISWGLSLGLYLDYRGVRLPRLFAAPVTLTHRLIHRALDRLTTRKETDQ